MAKKSQTHMMTLFPTRLYQGFLPNAARLNASLRREIQTLETIDKRGARWSRDNYVGGYSSYSSLCQLHRTSPTFTALAKRLAPHIRAFVNKLNWELLGRKVHMTTCWANSMGEGTYHTLHLHPGSVISGVYYVDMPPGSSALKIEDPRMHMFMAAPPRHSEAPTNEQNYLLLKGTPTKFYLFESWLRHEVPPHRDSRRRVSVSFNYEWV